VSHRAKLIKENQELKSKLDEIVDYMTGLHINEKITNEIYNRILDIANETDEHI